MPTTCLQYKGIDYMSTVQRHWLQHVYSTKAFSWRQNISNINRFQQSPAQYWQALPNPKALATKREALFKLPLGVNINQSFLHFWMQFLHYVVPSFSASGFWIIWIIGPLGIALDCRPGSNVIAPSHPYIQQVHARRPTVNERLPSNTPNKILRAPIIDIISRV